MDEYIKREAVLKIIEDNCPHDKGGYNTEEEMGAGSACYYIRKDIEGLPTADVAPRAEVANKICCEIEEEIVAALESNYRALKERDDGRCNDYILEMVNRIKGKIDALRGIEGFVDELKKKYTEEQT